MKWKSRTKQFGEKQYQIEFLILPMKKGDYWYWLDWGVVEYTWIGYKWSKGKLIQML